MRGRKEKCGMETERVRERVTVDEQCDGYQNHMVWDGKCLQRVSRKRGQRNSMNNLMNGLNPGVSVICLR